MAYNNYNYYPPQQPYGNYYNNNNNLMQGYAPAPPQLQYIAPPQFSQQQTSYPQARPVKLAQGEPLKVWGSENTMNLDPAFVLNIKESNYMKSVLLRLVSVDQIMPEIVKEVKFLEPYTTMSKIPSTAFCLLYKLYSIRLTDLQMEKILTHDSAFVRALGILYLRLTFDPHHIMEWLEDFLFDNGEVCVRDRAAPITIGELTRDLLLEKKFCEIYLPKWPFKDAKSITDKVNDHADEIPKTKQSRAQAKNQKRRGGASHRTSSSSSSSSPSPHRHSSSSSRRNHRGGSSNTRRSPSPRRNGHRRSPSPRRSSHRRSPSPRRGSGRRRNENSSSSSSSYRRRSRSPSPSSSRRYREDRGRRAYREEGDYSGSSLSPSPEPRVQPADLEKIKSRYAASTSTSCESNGATIRSQTENDRLVLGRNKN